MAFPSFISIENVDITQAKVEMLYLSEENYFDDCIPLEDALAITSNAPSVCSASLMTEIIETNLEALKRFALRLARNHDLASEVVQQTCLKAWSRRETYRTDKPVKPWLFSIMRNEYLQLMRKRTPLTNVDDSLFERHDLKQSISYPYLEVIKLWESLRDLPDDQRDALTLVSIMGYSYDEAGNACGCAAGTIKSRVNRGKQRVREALGELFPTGTAKAA